MSTIDCISQTGIVEEVGKQSIRVKIVSKSACSNCHSKGSCTSMDMAEKQITVNLFDSSLKPGDTVVVKMKKTLGTKAVFLGYGLPFLLFLISLISIQKIWNNELFAGLGSILILTVYYLILKLFTRQLEKTFTFEAEKA